MFSRDHLFEVWAELDFDPQPVEQAIAVERSAKNIGVVALRENQAVSARGPQNDAHFIFRKAGERTVGSKEIIAMFAQQPVDRGKTFYDGLNIVSGIDRDFVEGWSILATWKRDAFADQPHLIGPGFFKRRQCVRRKLAGCPAEPAHLYPFVVPSRPHSLRQEANSQDRVTHYSRGEGE